MTTKYTGRKFVIALAGLGLLAWLRFTGHITDGTFETGYCVTVIAYITGNVYQAQALR